MADHIPTCTTERIATANRQIHTQQVTALVRRREQDQRRRQIEAIDEVIAVLEEVNLDGKRHVDRAMRRCLRQLEEEVLVPVPRKVLRARNTARLHGALLDWMETVLDELMPERRRLWADVDLD